jgi:hypothetical protein
VFLGAEELRDLATRLTGTDLARADARPKVCVLGLGLTQLLPGFRERPKSRIALQTRE